MSVMGTIDRSTRLLFQSCRTTASSVAVALVLFSCSPTGTGGGSGTGLGNGIISGKVTYADGSPARSTIVRLRPQTYLADTSGIASTARTNTIVTTATDSTGCFSIDSICRSASYCLEINDDKNHPQGTLYKLLLADKDTVLATRAVGPTKTIDGTVKFSGVPENAYILIYGMERVAKTDANGKFDITGLPAGKCEEGECEYKILVIIPLAGGGTKTVQSEMEVEFDGTGNIVTVEVELDDDDDENDD
jgi:hypothetical protein